MINRNEKETNKEETTEPPVIEQSYDSSAKIDSFHEEIKIDNQNS